MKEINSNINLYGTYGQFRNIGEYVECEINLEYIVKEFDYKTYDRVIRSSMSRKKKEERDKKTHMVDVA